MYLIFYHRIINNHQGSFWVPLKSEEIGIMSHQKEALSKPTNTSYFPGKSIAPAAHVHPASIKKPFQSAPISTATEICGRSCTPPPTPT